MTRGTRRPVPEKKLSVNVGLHNRFDIEVRDAATGELRQRARAFNVICDTLWDRLLSTSSDSKWAVQLYSAYILFGSGAGTPAASDTALFDQVGYRGIGANNTGERTTFHSDVLNGSAYIQTYVVLQAGDNVGDTLTEVGIGYDTTHCVTHAMLEDMNGNPISIEKTATDVITIYATIYFHWSAGGWANGSIFIADNIGTNEGISSQYQKNVLRVLAGRFSASDTSAHYARFYPKVMGAAEPMYNGSGADVYSTFTVNKAAKKATATCRYNVGVGNAPIRFINAMLNFYSGSTLYSAQFCRMLSEGWYTPATISGEAVGTGDGSATVFRTAFPVKTAGTVKVNGAAMASGVAMRTGAINRTNAAYWLRPVAGKTSANTILYTLFPAGQLIHTSDSHTVLEVYNKTAKVVENPFYADGITEFVIRAVSNASTITIEASDDLASWDAICTNQAFPASGSGPITVSVPAALQNKRFFRLCTPTASNSNYGAFVRFVAGDGAEGNIIFDAPPAAGAVITADYTPDCIAKDEDHVFDLTLEITFGEYQEV